MATLHDRVNKALQARFRDLVHGLEVIKATNRVTGFVVSPDFDGLDDKARQDLLWKVLQESLAPADLPRGGPIATLTPAEAEIDVSVDE